MIKVRKYETHFQIYISKEFTYFASTRSSMKRDPLQGAPGRGLKSGYIRAVCQKVLFFRCSALRTARCHIADLYDIPLSG